MAQKLYTEEQVRHAYNEGCWNGFNEVSDKEDYTINSLTPIELPSDEEIYFESRRYEKYHESMNELESERSAARYHGHMQGAKYVINKILNKINKILNK